MKKLLLLIALLFLSSCMTVNRKEDSGEKEQYIILKKSSMYLIDMCEERNMPRYPHRPKLKSEELKELSEKEMDERIKNHITALEKHVDSLEGIILKTRQRVDACR